MALDDPEHFTALSARHGSQNHPDQSSGTRRSRPSSRIARSRPTLPAPLPPHTIETLVAAAQSAASSPNQHLWSVVAVADVAVTDRDLRSGLAVLARNQRHIEEAPLLLLWVADVARTPHIGEQKQAPTDGTQYLDSFLTAALDAALAAKRRRGRGIAGTWHRLYRRVENPSGRGGGNRRPSRRGSRDLRPGRGISGSRAAGTRQAAAGPGDRAPPRRFTGHADAPSLEAYDAASRDFQNDQGQPNMAGSRRHSPAWPMPRHSAAEMSCARRSTGTASRCSSGVRDLVSTRGETDE